MTRAAEEETRIIRESGGTEKGELILHLYICLNDDSILSNYNFINIFISFDGLTEEYRSDVELEYIKSSNALEGDLTQE